MAVPSEVIANLAKIAKRASEGYEGFVKDESRKSIARARYKAGIAGALGVDPSKIRDDVPSRYYSALAGAAEKYKDAIVRGYAWYARVFVSDITDSDVPEIARRIKEQLGA